MVLFHGTPTPDPARIVGGLELVVVAIAALAQAFLKIGFLHALAPIGKEPTFLVVQLLTLAVFAWIGVMVLKHQPADTVKAAA